MEFGQLIEHNVKNIFLRKSWWASPIPFYKKIKIEHISWSTVWNIIKFVFIVCLRRGLPKYIKTKVPTTCF